MGKIKEIDIDMRNAVDAAMEEINQLTPESPDDVEAKLRQTLQSVYAQATWNTAGMIGETKTLTVKRKAIKVRPEIVTGIVLILVAALFPVDDQNKIIFGFGVGIMYLHLVREFVSVLGNIRVKLMSKQINNQ
jgi:hypothetical protein